MVDECADISNQEQVYVHCIKLYSLIRQHSDDDNCHITNMFFFLELVVVFRRVDHTLSVSEEFMGLYSLPFIQAWSIVLAIPDSLDRFNLAMIKIRGQCYDGASNMRGVRNGVATQIQEGEPRSIYTHCYDHSLNLTASDTIQQCKVMRAALETTFEITKLVNNSPRREQLFHNIKDEIAPTSLGVRVLCPTQWTVRAYSMMSIIQNYQVLNEL